MALIIAEKLIFNFSSTCYYEVMRRKRFFSAEELVNTLTNPPEDLCLTVPTFIGVRALSIPAEKLIFNFSTKLIMTLKVENDTFLTFN